MEGYRIKLNCEVAYFREIFFENRQGSIFSNDVTRTPFRLTILFVLLMLAIYFAGFYLPKISWLLVLGFLLLVFALIYFITASVKFFTWKDSVDKYLETISGIKVSELLLKEDVFELRIDDRIIIESFNSVKRIDITPQRVIMTGEHENYCFPARAMLKEDFEIFVSHLKERGKK